MTLEPIEFPPKRRCVNFKVCLLLWTLNFSVFLRSRETKKELISSNIAHLLVILRHMSVTFFVFVLLCSTYWPERCSHCLGYLPKILLISQRFSKAGCSYWFKTGELSGAQFEFSIYGIHGKKCTVTTFFSHQLLHFELLKCGTVCSKSSLWTHLWSFRALILGVWNHILSGKYV